MKIVLRPYEPGDQGFVLSTWLKGLYYGNPLVKQTPQAQYFRDKAVELLRLLAEPDTTTTIACHDDEPSCIAGYSCYTGECVHWVYVKKDYRSQGICNLLLGVHEFKHYSNTTKAGAAIAQKRNLKEKANA